MGGEDMEIRWLFHEFCCPGKLRYREGDAGGGETERYLNGSWYCIFLLSPGS